MQAGDLKRQLRKALEREARFDERVIWKYFSQIADGASLIISPLSVAITHARCVTAAVQHMHQRRVMHRDLKVCASLSPEMDPRCCFLC